MNTIKGTLTNCISHKKSEIELEYEIEIRDGKRIFCILNGVTGWESFYIDSVYSNLDDMRRFGWCACAGTDGRYDRLFIPPEEMTKALQGIEKREV